MVCKSKTTVLISIFTIALLSSIPLAFAKLSGSLSEEAITERLQPVGTAKIAVTEQNPDQATIKANGLEGPEKIYTKNCMQCHKTGIAGAPKVGDKAVWSARMEQGLDALVEAAWTGIRAMPPKGNCLNCSKDDLRETIKFMVNLSK